VLAIHDNIFRVQFIVQTSSGIKLDFVGAVRWPSSTGLVASARRLHGIAVIQHPT
jgi:hypothetical protein